MPSLTESDLRFQFSDHWVVKSYDRQPFYLRMSGLGMKGVDFIALDTLGTGHLYLVEVKNYRTRETVDGKFEPKTIYPEDLAQTVAVKYEHTQRAIRALQLHYRRKWWYRLTRSYWETSQRYQSDTVFWTKAFTCLQSTHSHTLLLWLEQDQEDAAFEKSLLQVIAYELEKGTHILVGRSGKEVVPGLVVQSIKRGQVSGQS